MIYDGLEAIGRYRGLYRGLDVLIGWLAHNDAATLPNGTTAIDGERVYANVMDAHTRHPADAHFETHRRYLDVQIDLEGSERFLVTPGAVVACGAWDDANDKGYCDAAPSNEVLLEGVLGDGRFAVFVVGEPHMPNLTILGTEPGPIRKVCFKVLDNRFW